MHVSLVFGDRQARSKAKTTEGAEQNGEKKKHPPPPPTLPTVTQKQTDLGV